MKKTLTLLSMLLAFTSFSQTAIKKSSIDSGGATTTNGTLAMVYTMGEVAVQENTNGTVHISEGFIGTDTMQILGLDNYTQLVGVQFYPNPSTDFVNLRFPKAADYEISIYDLLGKEITKYQVTNSDAQRIALGQLPNAVYLVLIKNENTKEFISYKLIKQ